MGRSLKEPEEWSGSGLLSATIPTVLDDTAFRALSPRTEFLSLHRHFSLQRAPNDWGPEAQSERERGDTPTQW